jgi:hypothetical protein
VPEHDVVDSERSCIGAAGAVLAGISVPLFCLEDRVGAGDFRVAEAVTLGECLDQVAAQLLDRIPGGIAGVREEIVVDTRGDR